MRVLHVSIGNPELRSGGLNRYCMELMKYQESVGVDTYLLYPGTFWNSKKAFIQKVSDSYFRLNNSLPQALFYGISKPENYLVNTNVGVFRRFLSEIAPDVIHVHSFQGIHKEFFDVAYSMNIPMVFTTHDYYPMCFRCVLMNESGEACFSTGIEECIRCNENAGMSLIKQRIIQSDTYQKLKNNKLIRSLKANNNSDRAVKVNDSNSIPETNGHHLSDDEKMCYIKLKNYCFDIMSKMTIIHANSVMTGEVYKKYFPKLDVIPIPITHSGLNRTRHERYKSDVLNIAYMGGQNIYKGYDIIKVLINSLIEECNGSSWNIWLYGSEYENEITDERVHYVGMFEISEENDVWNKTDLLIVPSQWMETFGFIVIEALAHGIPVLCSEYVGSQEIVESIDKECVFTHDDNEELLKKVMRFMDFTYYTSITQKIENSEIKLDMEKHTCEIINLYNSLMVSTK